MTQMWYAFLTGLIISAIPGPATMLFMRYVFGRGLRVALFLGLGVAVADVLYAIVAGLGISFIAQTLVKFESSLKISTAIFLISLGIYESLPARHASSCELDVPSKKDKGSIYCYQLEAFGMGFLLVLLNPLTILFFLGLFSSIPSTGIANSVLAIFLGSMAWWVFFGNALKLIKAQITPFWMMAVRKSMGVLLIILGAIMLSQIF